MAKDITLKSRDGSTTFYPKTVSDLVYDNDSGQTVKEQIDTLGQNVDKLNEESPRCINSSESDLQFSDENGNVIASFNEGHFKTKEFDSKKVSNIVELFELRELDKILPLNSTYVFRGTPVHGISGHFDATGQDFIAFCVAHEGSDETDHTIQLYLKYGNDYKYSGNKMRGCVFGSTGIRYIKQDGTIASANYTSSVEHVTSDKLYVLTNRAMNGFAEEGVAYGAVIIGKALTDDEVLTLNNSLKTMFDALK